MKIEDLKQISENQGLLQKFSETLLLNEEDILAQQELLKEEQEKEEARKIANRMFGIHKEPLVKMKTPGRNSKCPCGSGRKYKHCCMEADVVILNKIYDQREQVHKI